MELYVANGQTLLWRIGPISPIALVYVAQEEDEVGKQEHAAHCTYDANRQSMLPSKVEVGQGTTACHCLTDEPRHIIAEDHRVLNNAEAIPGRGATA